MNEMQIFQYENSEVRTVSKEDGVWWVLTDVCRVLEIQNNRNVARRLDEDEKGVHLMDTPGGSQKLTIISESGLYKVILRSDKYEAKKFTRWVTHEVLPTIRKTGGYGDQIAGLTKLTEQLCQVTMALVQTATAITVAAEKITVTAERITSTVEKLINREENPDLSKPKLMPSEGYNAARCKLETFPAEITDQVDGMLSNMLQQQALNFSMIARYCTINGYTITSPAVKTYFQRHFSES